MSEEDVGNASLVLGLSMLMRPLFAPGAYIGAELFLSNATTSGSTRPLFQTSLVFPAPCASPAFVTIHPQA